LAFDAGDYISYERSNDTFSLFQNGIATLVTDGNNNVSINNGNLDISALNTLTVHGATQTDNRNINITASRAFVAGEATRLGVYATGYGAIQWRPVAVTADGGAADFEIYAGDGTISDTFKMATFRYGNSQPSLIHFHVDGINALEIDASHDVTIPNGDLTVAGTLNVGTAGNFNALVINPQGLTNEGGEFVLAGAGVHHDWAMDVFVDRFRWISNGTEWLSVDNTTGAMTAPSGSISGTNLGIANDLSAGAGTIGFLTSTNGPNMQFWGGTTANPFLWVLVNNNVTSINVDQNNNVFIPNGSLDINAANTDLAIVAESGLTTTPPGSVASWFTALNAFRPIALACYRNATGAAGIFQVYSDNFGAQTVSYQINGDGTVTATSDGTLKTNVQPVLNGMDLIRKFNPVTFDWIKSGTQGIGFIAQEIQKILPVAVQAFQDSNILGLDKTALIAPIVAALKELDIRIQSIEDLETT